jgi:hypothetical protein
MTKTTRNRILYGAAALLLVGAGVLLGARSMQAEGPVVRVVKSPTCGCCAEWVEHLEENGFRVEVEDTRNPNVAKANLGVPSDLSSCHTAEVGGYVVEGHVPASEIRRLLDREPEGVKGIAVPGMPAGSPGMPGVPEPYDVVAFDGSGNRAVWASY